MKAEKELDGIHMAGSEASLGPALCELLSGTCGCDHRSRNTSMSLL